MFSNFQFHMQADNPMPKYRQLASALEHYLRTSGYSAGRRLPSDRELSRFLGISSMTLLRSLNELVRRGLLERRVGDGTYLLDVSSSPAMAYRIGVVSHEIIQEDGGFITTLTSQMQLLAASRGIDLIQFRRNPSAYALTMKEHGLDGLVVISPSRNMLSDIQKLSDSGMNLVQIGVYHPKLSAISFGTDHHAAAIQAVKYLVDLGHRRIGLLSRWDQQGDALYCGGEERKDGYRQGMWQVSLPVNPCWEIDLSSCDREKLRGAIESLRQGQCLPTAFLLGNIGLAPLVFSVLQESGLGVPRDISLIGFDNGPLCLQFSPALTVFDQQIQRTAQCALDCLLARLEGRQPVSHPPIPCLFLERASCRSMKS
ncbi:MAG: substrate-binding domain-containing protein [Victivallales bacterium]|nr:substrate-binding domain-containing protein [Victivallales bacterium]